jgi:hypothetical protein
LPTYDANGLLNKIVFTKSSTYIQKLAQTLQSGAGQRAQDGLELPDQLQNSREQSTALDQLIQKIVGHVSQILQQLLDQLLDHLQKRDKHFSQRFDQVLEGSNQIVDGQIQDLGYLSNNSAQVTSQVGNGVFNLK